VVLNEELSGRLCVTPQASDPFPMLDLIHESCRPPVPKRSMQPPELMGYRSTNIDLDPLDSFNDQAPQDPVEFVGLDKLLKCGPGSEPMPIGFEGKAVSTQSVVVDEAQCRRSCINVCDPKPPGLKQLYLVSM